VWTFLLRTPDLVEAGVRNELNDRLSAKWKIRKETIPLKGTSMTIAPDLVIGYGDAIGDVKYKLTRQTWLRADLYEVTAFATAAGAPRAAIVSFRAADDPQPPTVGIGGTEVRHFAWLADAGVTPVSAGESLAGEIAAWLQGG
jgi:hypothetical protein